MPEIDRIITDMWSRARRSRPAAVGGAMPSHLRRLILLRGDLRCLHRSRSCGDRRAWETGIRREKRAVWRKIESVAGATMRSYIRPPRVDLQPTKRGSSGESPENESPEDFSRPDQSLRLSASPSKRKPTLTEMPIFTSASV